MGEGLQVLTTGRPQSNITRHGRMPTADSEVSDTRHYKFRSRPEAVAAARRALDGYERLLDLSVFYDASLCVSELVTNAVLHADAGSDDELELVVSIDEGWLTVAVLDSGSGFSRRAVSPGDESGWGLFIVDRLSDRWGVEHDARTRVWFEMRAAGEQSSERVCAVGAAANRAPVAGGHQVEEAAAGRGRSARARLRLRPQAVPGDR